MKNKSNQITADFVVNAEQMDSNNQYFNRNTHTISNKIMAEFVISATKMAHTVFCGKQNIMSNPDNISDIVGTAIMLQLSSWRKKGIVAENFNSVDRLPGLLKDAAIELHFMPKNTGAKKPNELTGMTQCETCDSEFNWEDADWRYKNGTRTNKAFCPHCKTKLETCNKIFPIELLSTSVEDNEGCFNYLTTQDAETIKYGKEGANFYREEKEQEEDDCIIHDERLKVLMKSKALAPAWFPEYAQLFMKTKLTQKAIAGRLNMTESQLSDNLIGFKKQTRKLFGITPEMTPPPAVKKTKAGKHTKTGKKTEQMPLF